MFRNIMDAYPDRVLPEPNSGCWIWMGRMQSAGYGIIHEGGKSELAHRKSFKLTKADPVGLFVCHKCDNPLCVNPDHLFLGTDKDNMDDAVGKGRHNYGALPILRGENSRTAKLTEIEALEIRASVGSCKNVANRYGVTAMVVSKIRRKLLWGWL